MTDTPLCVADVLERAADLIEPEGAWVQGAGALDGNGRPVRDGDYLSPVCWCIGGAVNQVIREPVDHHPAWTFLQAFIGDSVPSWNDDPKRTQSEVVAKLREAANVARAGDA